MKKWILVSIICLVGIINFSIVEWETFENTHNGYKGILITLDEPARRIFEYFKIDEIEFPGRHLISFNTFEY